jgi:transposase
MEPSVTQPPKGARPPFEDQARGLDLLFGTDGDPRRTIALLEPTSTSQDNSSPGSSPSTVATDCGTVVFKDSDPETARNSFEVNRFGTHYAPGYGRSRGHISGLSRGRRIDLILKYARLNRSIDRPMPGTRGPYGSDVEERAIRLISSHRDAIRPQGRVAFEVSSLDGARKYAAVCDQDGWSCTCPFWEERKTPCKHIVATVRWLDPNPPPIIEEPLSQPKRRSYRQPDDGIYDEAQQQEHQLFDALLWDLLGTVPDHPLLRAPRGRPAIPLRTIILVAVRKVHLAQSSRRARGLLVALNRDGKGILPRVPNYTAPSRFFNTDQATPLLLGLIEASGLILKEIEDRGTVAIDSSGFCTSCTGAYLTEKHDPSRKHKWLKAHIAVGVKTHIVLSVEVTDEYGADYSQFVPLLRRLYTAGHRPSYVVADKAYLGRGNLEGAGDLGMEPYIPFKVNSRGLSKRAPMWNRKFHEFMARRDEFDEIYHRRSNVEATFSAIKRKLGEPLLSHNQGARINELLAKILAYNIGVVIKESLAHGISPGPIGFSAAIPTEPTGDPLPGEV